MFRICPWNVEAVSWLGVYHAKQEDFKNAAAFFRRASELESWEPKWRIMAALCLRKSGQLGAALVLYQQAYDAHPENEAAVSGLIRTRKALGLVTDDLEGVLTTLQQRMAREKKQTIQGSLPSQ